MTARVAEIIDVQALSGQEVLNVYHYVDPDGVGSIDTLVADFVTSVIPLFQSAQGGQLSHRAIRHRTVYPTASLMLETAITPPLVGSASGEQLASCDALSVKHILGNPTVVLAGGFTGHIKRGGFRMAGATEGAVSGNDCMPGTITGMAVICAELRNPGADAFLLCVASFLNGARARQHTVQAYTIVSGNSAPSPSTQNSRKVLRGRTF